MTMNLKTLAVVAAVALSGSGCIVVAGGGGGGGGPRNPGDVTFTWSFAGGDCAANSDVKNVIVTIAGQTLANDGVYPCSANNYPGITLLNFAPGTYSFEIEARSYTNMRIFTGAGTFTVNGDTRVNIDLTPVGGGSSYALLTWTFPTINGAPGNCTTAQVSSMLVSIDGAAPTRLNCTAGQGGAQVQTPYMAAGTHTIDIQAVNSTDYTYFRKTSTLQTFSGNPVSANYTLDWAVGGAALKWSFTNGTSTLDCAQAGVSQVFVNFFDQQGNAVYSGEGDARPCADYGVVYSYLRGGAYSIRITAYGTGNRSYRTNLQNPPGVNVTNGTFPTIQQANTATLFQL